MDTLPNEILFEIFEYIPGNINCIAPVSKRFAHVVARMPHARTITAVGNNHAAVIAHITYKLRLKLYNWLGESNTSPELIFTSDLCDNKLKVIFPHAVYYKNKNSDWWSMMDTSARINIETLFDNIKCRDCSCTFCYNFMAVATLKFKKYQKILRRFEKHL